MRRSAVIVRTGDQPDSLMARLARLDAGPRTTVRTRPRLTQRYFGLGLLASGLLGCAVIIALPHGTAEQVRDGAVAGSAAALPPPFRSAAAVLPPPASIPRATPAAAPSPQPRATAKRTAAVEPPGPPPPLNMNLARSGKDPVPFPLQVTDVADPDNTRVILRDMPATARLTGGERRDERTWALRLGELPGLRVTLGAGTPEIFDIVIEIASTSGEQILQTGARIRLNSGDGSGAPRRLPSTIEDLLRDSKAVIPPPVRAPVETPFHTEVSGPAPVEATPPPGNTTVAKTPEPSEPPEITETERKPLPEGLSALGGPVKGADAGEQSEVRQLWWKLPSPAPTPAWAPFGNSSAQ
jgi:hypothetical protein